jgi:hypothetical protein
METYTTTQRMAWGLGEISEFTGLSLAFLRNEVRAGRLPVRRFGRRVLVKDEDLRRSTWGRTTISVAGFDRHDSRPNPETESAKIQAFLSPVRSEHSRRA